MPDEQIIYLDPNDELITVRERIEEVRARRITMIVPQQTQLRSSVGWRLLHARARELGKEVQVISPDRQVRAVAKAAGFRVSQPPEGSSGGRTRVPPSQNQSNVGERRGMQRQRQLFNRGATGSQVMRRREPTVSPPSSAPEEATTESLPPHNTWAQQENPPALPEEPGEPTSRQGKEDAYPPVEIIEDDKFDQPFEYRLDEAQPSAAHPLPAHSEVEHYDPYIQDYDMARRIREAAREASSSRVSNPAPDEQKPVSAFPSSHFSTPPEPAHVDPFEDIEELSTSLLPAQCSTTPPSEMQDIMPDVADIPTGKHRIEDMAEETDTQDFPVRQRDEDKQPDDGNEKKGLPLFNRRPKLVPNANVPTPLESFDEPVKPVVPVPQNEEAEPVRPRSKSGPIPIPIALPQSGAATRPLNPDAQGANGITSPDRSGNTGKQAAIGAAAVGAGAAAAFVATSPPPAVGGGQPPIRGNTSGSDGGGGRPQRRSSHRWLTILLVLLSLLLLDGIAFASPGSINPTLFIVGAFIIFFLFIIFLVIFLVRFFFLRKLEADGTVQANAPSKLAVSNNRVSSPPQNVLNRTISVSSASFDLKTNKSQPNINIVPQPAYRESNIRLSQPQQPEKAKIEDHQTNQTNTVQQQGMFPIPPIISKPVTDQSKGPFHKPELTQQGLDFAQNSQQAGGNIPFTPEAVKRLPKTPLPSQQISKVDDRGQNADQKPQLRTTPSNEVMKVFYCYAREDKALRDELEKHLSKLIWERKITSWYDRDIGAGKDWEKEININLRTADIILLLISPDFIHSPYCYGIEMKTALERNNNEEARAIPIILRPCDWEDEQFSELQVLPTDGKPVTSWHSPDEAFYNIAKSIRKVVNELLEAR